MHEKVLVHNLFTELKPLLLIHSNIFHAKIENPLLNNIHMKGGNVYGLKEIINKTLMFHVEGALLKSSSVFPYFMLVAFEAGGPLRALLLLLSYPFVCLVGEELGLKIMVFLCFFGIKEKSFRIGKAVLPKFFLEDVGYEGFLMVMKGVRNKVAVTDLPRVMVDGFLTDFLGVNSIVGRELKVAGGYFLGLMEEKETNSQTLNQILGSDEKTGSDHQFIGIGCSNKPLDQQLFSKCKEVYLVSEAEKQNWQTLPREKYPKPLIFHDGRLAFRPTPFATLAAFMWVPFGIFICLFRLIIAELFPFSISVPILSFTGMRTEVTRPPSCFPINILIPTRVEEKKGKLYACNHRTVIDPIYVSLAIMKPVTALTYSISRFTELISPIKTVRLTRNKEIDSKILEKLLSRGEDIVICPEGTTCREPYLLRFSPLFAELSDEIVPVAINTEVSMFHGTTASGFKFLDPLFFMMNPFLTCSVEVLEKLPRSLTSQGGEKTKFEVANLVQKQIANALSFESSGLSRKDKYLFLTGN